MRPLGPVRNLRTRKKAARETPRDRLPPPPGPATLGAMTVTVFHNPNCGTSRNVLQMVRDAGHDPQVVEYLKTGWTRDQLTDLLTQMDARPRDVLRVRGTRAEELGLTDPSVSDDALIDAMVADPALVERPIVRAPSGTVLARPKEKVLPLLAAL